MAEGASWDMLLQGVKTPTDRFEQMQVIMQPLHTYSGAGATEGQDKAYSRSKQIKSMFRAGYDYYVQHTPEKWQGLVFGATESNQPDAGYWAKAAEDIKTVAATFDNDLFITSVLTALYDEMEREYRTMRKEALEDGENRSTGH